MKLLPNHKRLAGVFGALSLTLLTRTAGAAPVTVLDENFDDGTNTTVQSLLSSNPAALPTGTAWSSTTGATAVNLRLGTDTINTYNAGNPNQRFGFASGSPFFNPNTATNKFLVMGDDSGQIAGSPDNGTFGFAMPFSVPDGTTAVTFNFDWVFKAFVLGGTNGSTDQFVAGVKGSGFDINAPLNTHYSVVSQAIVSQGAFQGPANVTVPLASLGAPDANGQYYLMFGLFENTGSSPTTNGAIGVDNIKITAEVAAVPVPPALWLFGSALAGMGIFGRRGTKAA